MSTFDVRDQVPRAGWEIGRYAPKSSVTIHWNGPGIDYAVDPMELILGDAHYQMQPDWPGAPGGADGIMYHRLYAPNGDCYIVRDDDAVLWHCADPWGNQSSWAWQVMTGLGEEPTAAQLAAVARDLRAKDAEIPNLTVHPHRFWTATTCPGETLARWVTTDIWRQGDDDVLTKDALLGMLDDPEVIEKVYTVVALKKALAGEAHHRHGITAESGHLTTEPLIAPVDGATYFGMDSTQTEVGWTYPDRTIHWFKDGVENRPSVTP